jgi:hypothetical protein
VDADWSSLSTEEKVQRSAESAATNWEASLIPKLRVRLAESAREARFDKYDARVERRNAEALQEASNAIKAVRSSKDFKTLERNLDYMRGLGRRHATDALMPVGAADPERAIALKKHEEGLTKSQDKTKARDERTVRELRAKLFSIHAQNDKAKVYFPDEAKGSETVAEMRHRLFKLEPQDGPYSRAKDGVKCQCESSVGCGHGGGPCGNTATRDVPTIYGGYKMCRTCAEALPAEYKKGSDMKHARDIQGHEIREKLGISEAEWAKLDKSARQGKAREALARGKDEVMPVGDKLTEEEKVGRRQYSLATSEARRKAAKEKKEEGKKAKDTELPTAVKTSNLVPMPSGEHNEVSYAPRRIAARDRGRFKKVGDGDGAWTKGANGWLEYYIDGNWSGKARHEGYGSAEGITKYATNNALPSLSAAKSWVEKTVHLRKRATDAIANLPLQTSGSDPADHMQRANEYEVAGDRARALDSYRAAASGYRKANDRANEGKARDGVEACQAKFSTQYQHPGAGRVKVCDSAEQAMRTAVERTRAGESVSVVGKTVRPGRAYRGSARDAAREIVHEGSNGLHYAGKVDKSEPGAVYCERCDGYYVKVPKSVGKDEHEGFKKLEGKLSHEKGVTNPAALAASIGRKKYGEKGMEARAKDVSYSDGVEQLVQEIKRVVKDAKAEGTVGMSKANLKQLVHAPNFPNANAFERGFEEALQKAGVRGFARAMDAEYAAGDKVLYGNRPCTVLHVYSDTLDLKTQDGYKQLGVSVSKVRPYAKATDSRREVQPV